MVYVYNVISIILVAWFLRCISGIDKKKFFFFFCLIQMTLIIGLRYQVGADYIPYERMYNYLGGGVYVGYKYDTVEIGYSILNQILWKIGVPYWGLNLLIAFLTILFMLKAIKEWSVDFFLSVYLYISFFFFYHAMNQTRQGLAIAIGLYAVALLSKGNVKKFLFWIIFGSLFHITLLIFLPLFFLRKIEFNKSALYIYTATIFVLFIGFSIIIQLIQITRYSIYINSFYDLEGLTSSKMNLAVRVIMLILALIRYKSVADSTKKRLLYHMIMICTVFQILTIRSSLFGRVTTPFFGAYIFLIPDLIYSVRGKYQKLIYYGCIGVATLYQIVYFNAMSDSVLVNKYKSILFH